MSLADNGSKQQSMKQNLRVGGFMALIGGGILTAIGFSSIASPIGDPTQFWWALVGVPLVGVGLYLIRLGYLGEVTRYVAGEVSPGPS